jgi:hypothetical protein
LIEKDNKIIAFQKEKSESEDKAKKIEQAKNILKHEL